MATLKDIAEIVGVSVSAVSLAIRNHGSISEETKRRVREAQQELGYQPNPLRRPPRPRRKIDAKKISDIAFVLINQDMTHPHYAHKFQAVTRFSRTHRFRPIYLHSNYANACEELPGLIEESGARGIIVTGDYDLEIHRRLLSLKLPIVVSGNYMLDSRPYAACEIDLRQGMRMMIEHLHTLGHRRVDLLIIGYGERFIFDLETSFNHFSKKFGLTSTILLKESDPSDEEIRALLNAKDRPTALILSTDYAAIQVGRVASSLGISIPHDLSVTAYNSEQNLLHPYRMTMVDTDFDGIGRVTLQKLFAQMDDPSTPLAREIVPMTFNEGDSALPLGS